jgi:Tfp pilus assembly protein PilN
MKLTAKTALGVDISHKQINLALLKKSADGIRLLRAACGSVPAGVIKNGIVENPSSLAAAVRDLRVKNKIGAHHQAVLSVIGGPVLIQILELPEGVPANIGEFVRSEVKHCAMLPAGRVTSDFCGLKPPGKSFGRRLLMAAADTQKLTEFAAALEKNGLNIVAIEPASLAYVRACYYKRIAKKFDQNLLLAMVREDVFTLYLFRNEILDFVTTKRFEPADGGDSRNIEWLAEEIKAVIRFYDFEVSEKRSKWDVEIVMDKCDSLPKEKMDMLHLLLTEAAALKIRTFEEASVDTPLANPDTAAGTSAVAIGLAMKLLQSGESTPNVNLLPLKLLEAKSEKKHRWMIVNIAAVVFIIMILSIGLFDAKVERLNSNTDCKMREEAIGNMRTLSHERTLIDEQIKDATQKLNNMSAASRGDCFLRWDKILEQVARAIPRAVRIHSLSSNGGSMMTLEGQAPSYEAVELFLNMLSKCEYIKSASLAGTEKVGESDKWIQYTINCSLTDRKEYQ